MLSYMLSSTFFLLSIYQVSVIIFFLFFIAHSSSFLPWIIGYPFINYDLSLHFYQLSIHQLATSYFLYSFFYNCLFWILNDCHRINLETCLILICRWKSIGCRPPQISNKNVYRRNYELNNHKLSGCYIRLTIRYK